MRNCARYGKNLTIIAFCVIFAAGCLARGEEYAQNGSRLFLKADYRGAANEFKMALRYHPRRSDWLFGLGLAYARQCELNGAQGAFKKLLEIDASYKPRILNAYRQMVDKTRFSQPNTAFLTVRQMTLLDPFLHLGEDAYFAGSGYFKTEEYITSLRYFEQAVNFAPAHALNQEARYHIAIIYRKLGDVRSSFLYFFLVDPMQLDNNSQADYYSQFGEVAYEFANEAYDQGESETALMAVNTLLEIGRPSTLIDDAYFLQGQALRELNRIEEAIASFQKTIDANPFQRGQLVIRAKDEIRRLRYGKLNADQATPSFDIRSVPIITNPATPATEAKEGGF